MAQTAMSETYGKTRGFAYLRAEGAGLGVLECWGLGSGFPELVSRILRFRGWTEILQTLRCQGPGGDIETLGMFRDGLGS